MNVNTLTLDSPLFPACLKHIPTPPKKLHIAGNTLDDLLVRPRVAIVGSRNITSYGKAVTAQLAGDLAKAGVVIVSGLALGTDAAAHRAALEVGGLTIAVLPAGLQTIYPSQHYQLAMSIIAQGGALITEYDEHIKNAYKSNFVARNRIVSGLSTIVVITEAAAKSGTLHTAEFAIEQGREVMAVPGNITSPTSAGTNMLIKNGVQPVLGASDVLAPLGMDIPERLIPKGDTPEQQAILDLIVSGEQDGTHMLYKTQLPIHIFDQHLTMLEITGKIRPLGNNKWTIA